MKKKFELFEQENLEEDPFGEDVKEELTTGEVVA